MSGLVACADLQPIPDVQTLPHTAAAAARADTATVKLFGKAIADFIAVSGVLTDELIEGFGDSAFVVDMRDLNQDLGLTSRLYANLQNDRVSANAAERNLAVFAPSAPVENRGRMYAVQGYLEIMIADLFCSGVPLSTIDLNTAHIVFGVPLSRDSIYQRAITHFDSALALTGANDSLTALSLIGKGRALLDLGQFSAAATTVANVPDNAHYKISLGFEAYDYSYSVTNGQPQHALLIDKLTGVLGDREGIVGLPYRSSHDPRTFASEIHNSGYFPNKYAAIDSSVLHPPNPDTAYVAFLLADGTEARLIQAEAALHANDPSTWLQILNHLRATASSLPLALIQRSPALTLAPLTDPGSADARVDLMFAERAAWLYLTGHRQGDLRRLMRQYGRTQSQVYPNGVYDEGTTYGTSVNVPVPSSEYANPHFHGCFDRLP